MWNLKNTKLVNITKRSRVTDTENKLVVAVRERGGGTIQEYVVKTNKLLCIKYGARIYCTAQGI